MNWLLPIGFVLFCAWRTADERLVSAFLVVLGSPLLVPAAALLSSIPRFTLRRSEVTATPSLGAGLLIIQWWSWVGIALAMPDERFDSSTRAGVPSLLQLAIGDSMGGVFAAWVLIASTVVGIASWIGLMMVATGPLRSVRTRAVDRMGALSIVAVPAVLVLLGLLGVGVSGLRIDAAGEAANKVSSRSADEQIALAQTRYEALQRAVSALRAELATERWSADEVRVEALDERGPGYPSYRFRFGFSHVAAGDLRVDPKGIAEVLGATGWEVGTVTDAPLRIEARRADGTALRLVTDGDMPLRIDVLSASWWQSGDAPVTTELAGLAGSTGNGYSARRWPDLE